jgi:hypothetical protein
MPNKLDRHLRRLRIDNPAMAAFLSPTLTSHISDYGIGRRELRTILRGSVRRGGIGTPFEPVEHTYLSCAYITGHDSAWRS